MSHQPFEAWIFAEEDLSSEQRESLKDHLAECAHCREVHISWEAARSGLSHPEMVGPEPGFEDRWRARQAERRQLVGKRQISWMLGLTVAAAGLLAIPLGLQILAMMDAPAAVGGFVIRDMIEIDLVVKFAVGLARSLAGEMSSRIAPVGWAGVGIGLLAFTAAWVFSLYRFAFQPTERGG
jgi:anti-sigma factor RsiW